MVISHTTRGPWSYNCFHSKKYFCIASQTVRLQSFFGREIGSSQLTHVPQPKFHRSFSETNSIYPSRIIFKILTWILGPPIFTNRRTPAYTSGWNIWLSYSPNMIWLSICSVRYHNVDARKVAQRPARSTEFFKITDNEKHLELLDTTPCWMAVENSA